MLAGERVTLRAPHPDDAVTFNEFWTDIEMASLAAADAPQPRSVEHTRKLLEKFEKDDDHVRFVIEVDGNVVGDCDLLDIDTHNRVCNIGISLGRAHWGKGYGQDALRLLVDYAFTHHNMHRIGLEVQADNDLAVGCYRKVGFVEEGTLRKRDWVNGTYRDVMVMGILDEEWSR